MQPETEREADIEDSIESGGRGKEEEETRGHIVLSLIEKDGGEGGEGEGGL